MSDRRRILKWAATSTRLIVGAAVAAAAVLAVALGVAAPWPTLVAAPASVEVTPAAADTVAACPGGLVALGRNVTAASELTLAAAQQVVHATGGAEAETSALTASPAVEGDTGAAVLTAAPTGGVRTDIAAAGSAFVDAADLRGYAASACRAPAMESWLVAGATTTGAGDVVLLGNPGEEPATVELTLYGAAGPETPPAARGIVVAPGTLKLVPLSSIGVGEEAPVLRVTASGAPVTAALQSSITRTLLPGGVDQTGPAVSAATAVVIPGVTVTDTAVAAAEAGATTRVRILSAQADATARVAVTDADGEVAATADVPLATGVPSEAGLSDLPEGVYTVTVTADAPVVAAAWQTTGFGEGADFAWYAATPEITGETLLAVPEGPSPRLVLTAVGGPVEVVVTPDRGGSGERVAVGAGETVAVEVSAETAYRLETDAAVHAMVSFAGGGALAAIPVWPADAAAAVLTVLP
ncbi:DUF5719 family protein [Microbacterium sp. GXF7504]